MGNPLCGRRYRRDRVKILGMEVEGRKMDTKLELGIHIVPRISGRMARWEVSKTPMVRSFWRAIGTTSYLGFRRNPGTTR